MNSVYLGTSLKSARCAVLFKKRQLMAVCIRPDHLCSCAHQIYTGVLQSYMGLKRRQGILHTLILKKRNAPISPNDPPVGLSKQRRLRAVADGLKLECHKMIKKIEWLEYEIGLMSGSEESEKGSEEDPIEPEELRETAGEAVIASAPMDLCDM